LTPIFHAVFAAINIWLLIVNYRAGNLWDAAMHTLFATNFIIMFIFNNVERPDDTRQDD
jgi:hypothetical protein